MRISVGVFNWRANGNSGSHVAGNGLFKETNGGRTQ